MKKLSMLGIIVGAALLSAAPFSLQWSQKNVALSLDSADARVGRPLTATSVAGVHRRHTEGHIATDIIITISGSLRLLDWGHFSRLLWPKHHSQEPPFC